MSPGNDIETQDVQAFGSARAGSLEALSASADSELSGIFPQSVLKPVTLPLRAYETYEISEPMDISQRCEYILLSCSSSGRFPLTVLVSLIAQQVCVRTNCQ